MRPIDADALKKDLMRFYDNEVTARELIDEQPTIEAQPVKHGFWKTRLSTHYSMKCSVCGSSSIMWERYCPNCGARMDGDSE